MRVLINAVTVSPRSTGNWAHLCNLLRGWSSAGTSDRILLVAHPSFPVGMEASLAGFVDVRRARLGRMGMLLTQHVRLDRPATVSLRTLPADGGPLELVPRTAAQGALDPAAHTAEVRRIASGAGRYGIGNLGVYVFPDLNTGNNTYKAVQRSAGAVAIGPVLQGLARPINDLSRGALVRDIVNTIAITAIQAQEAR